MVVNNPNREQKLEYSTVEFKLSNATSFPISVNVFETNTLADVPEQNGVDAFPDTKGVQFGLGIAYAGIAYDTQRGNIVVGGFTSLVVDVFDAKTNQLISSTPNARQLADMIYVASNDLVYGINSGSGGVSIINPSTGAETSLIPYPAAETFIDIAHCTISNKLYFIDDVLGGDLYPFDLATNAFLPSITIGGGLVRCSYLAYSSSNNSIYVASLIGGAAFYKVDCATDTSIGSVANLGTTPEQSIYNSVNNQIYFEDIAGNTVRILDVATDTITATVISSPAFNGNISDFAFSPLTNTIWGNDISNTTFFIDCNVNLVVGSFPLPPITSGQLVYAEDINTVFSTTDFAASQYIQRIDASGSQFFIDGSSDYNLFVNDNLVNPKRLDRVMIYAPSNAELLIPMGVNTVESTGDSCSVSRLPNITVGVEQFQGQIGQVDFENYILDVTASISYTIPALTEIKWVIYYKEYKRSDMLVGKSMIEEFDINQADDPDTYDEKYLIDTQLTPNWLENIEIDNFLETNKASI